MEEEVLTLKQASSVLDPDPRGSALLLGSWIRIQLGKNEKWKKITKFQVLKCRMFSYDVQGLSLL
jgi:hypothetical protein